MPFYIYNYSGTNNLRHLNMNLTARFNLSKEIERPLWKQHNYFDIYGYTKMTNASCICTFCDNTQSS